MKIGDYVRTKYGIAKIEPYDNIVVEQDGNRTIYVDKNGIPFNNQLSYYVWSNDVINSSSNIINLIEYMDLLWLKHPIKLYGSDTMIGLFNPVRCDGFTTFEDGTHCIILNLDYIVDIKDLKIKSILTHEQYEKLKYEVGDV